ncbi:hypothetical protein LRP30_44480 [Bradyrhizobium sp. C-145]|uniref:hypothetical protein n=1 Tax=Bradyrhizobium sp. C-145 TaxID=574727 RepID=UPI00201B4A3D|nr:hypothetical protein [Bradyrhizobium sp. C-145]UQR63674.1 hypothetical protein LRP30_44480 [Bradyrhizobium sp. C-145]
MPSAISLVFMKVEPAAHRFRGEIIGRDPFAGLVHLITNVAMIEAVLANVVQINRHSARPF